MSEVSDEQIPPGQVVGTRRSDHPPPPAGGIVSPQPSPQLVRDATVSGVPYQPDRVVRDPVTDAPAHPMELKMGSGGKPGGSQAYFDEKQQLRWIQGKDEGSSAWQRFRSKPGVNGAWSLAVNAAHYLFAGPYVIAGFTFELGSFIHLAVKHYGGGLLAISGIYRPKSEEEKAEIAKAKDRAERRRIRARHKEQFWRDWHERGGDLKALGLELVGDMRNAHGTARAIAGSGQGSFADRVEAIKGTFAAQGQLRFEHANLRDRRRERGAEGRRQEQRGRRGEDVETTPHPFDQIGDIDVSPARSAEQTRTSLPERPPPPAGRARPDPPDTRGL